MPKRTDIKKVLLIGSGPIVIGQACEFDYSGTQACKALKEEGIKVVLINSNPATIMTDPDIADRTYIEPLTLEYASKIIEKERPDAVLPTMGGQTALNLAVRLSEEGVLKKYGVVMLGASLDAIKKAEDRNLFKTAMLKIGLDVPQSSVVTDVQTAWQVARRMGFPLIIRPAFTLGGSGGNIALHETEFESMVEDGLRLSPIRQILIEEGVIGWKEFELEVMRDRKDNVVIICSIENVDPMGIHTGDSITVAPVQTLSDMEYQRMRNAAIAVIREIGVDTGGSNIQFAVNPQNGRMVVIEMNPRVSRSSALASKATGFPIAKIAAKLSVGYTLDEIPNDITRETLASFEPAIDYVVTKIPRFAFEKFPHASNILGVQMKSVGEVMAIGRTFGESLLKALRSLECGWKGLDVIADATSGAVIEHLKEPRPDRILWIGEAFRHGIGVDEVGDITKIDPWFLHEIKKLVQKDTRGEIHKSYRTVDTCAGEFIAYTPYFYSTEGEKDDPVVALNGEPVIILGSGPNRIGQGIEFDYACVQASFALKKMGIPSVMINCNPETVSTDYDTSDRLYFEPLTFSDVMPIIEREKPRGVIVQFGGQTPLKLALSLKAAGVKILGTDPADIDRAEDRKLFNALVSSLGLMQPIGMTATNLEGALHAASRIGYPVMVRPSYVLGGRSMEVVYDDSSLEFYMKYSVQVSEKYPILVDRFLAHATEVDVDAVSDGKNIWVAGIMEHIEEAGIHSGDSSCVLPPHSLQKNIVDEISHQTTVLARALNVVGLMNVQFAVTPDGGIYVLEVNPRASRTIPFVSKAIGVQLAQIATRVMLGEPLTMPPSPLMGEGRDGGARFHYSVKTPVFPFNKFMGVDTILGPEMRSTGEVMGFGDTFGEAFAKAQEAAGNRLPAFGTVFISVRDSDKEAIASVADGFARVGFKIIATKGTMLYLHEKGVPCVGINKVLEGHPNIVEAIIGGKVQLVINTTTSRPSVGDSYIIRRTALERLIPYFTTVEGARAAVAAIGAVKGQNISVRALQKI